MKKSENIHGLMDAAASQWGLVTSAQALSLGVSRTQLSRMAADGRLEQMARGTWRVAYMDNPPDLGAKAAWLSLFPKKFAWERLARRPHDAVVTGRTAAALHGDAALHPDPYTFVTESGKRTTRDDVRLCAWRIVEEDVRLVNGLPTASVERTVADLIRLREDPSLVGSFVRGCAARGCSFNENRLAYLLAPLAARNGYEKDDGTTFAREIISRDVEPAQRARIADEIRKTLGNEAAEQFAKEANA